MNVKKRKSAAIVDGYYIGWISPFINPNEAEKKILESLGIKVGKYNKKENEFLECVVSMSSLRRLDYYWGRFIWGLKFIKRK